VSPVGKAIFWTVLDAIPSLIRLIRDRRAEKRAKQARAIDEQILERTLDTAKAAREAAAKRKGR
jgi:hypothetical protein